VGKHLVERRLKKIPGGTSIKLNVRSNVARKKGGGME